MFKEGRVIIPAGGWYEWTVEEGKKQPWYIRRKVDEPIFMAGLTNHKPFTDQEVEVGFVIVTRDCEGGMVDVHDRRPVVLRPEDALALDATGNIGRGSGSNSPKQVTGNRRVHVVESG